MEDAARKAVNREAGVEEAIDAKGNGQVDGGSIEGRLPVPAVLLRTMVDVREHEVGLLLWAMAFLFSLMAGNYLIRPLRDEMGIAAGTANLPMLFMGTLAAMLVAAPLLSARLRRPGRPVIVSIFRAIQLLLAAFFAAFQLLPPSGQPWAARAFFIWASVINLLVVSIGWGILAGRFPSEQAHRLFGLIAAGGTLGAIAGSALAGMLAERVGTTPLLLAAAVSFELGLLAGRRLFWPRDGEKEEAIPVDDALAPATEEDPDPARSRYLAGLGLWTLLFTSTSAVIYMEQARIVNASILDPSTRTAFFARIDLLVNLLGLVLQLTLTGGALALLGAGGVAALLPVVTLIGVVLLYMNPTVATVKWFQVARRAVDYSLARPSREVFYTVVGRAELLRGKGLIDTAVYRAGDAAGAWTYGLLAAVPGLATAAPLAVVPLSLAWIALSLSLGRSMKRRIARHGVSPPRVSSGSSD
jgi:AAA family ATP:ADP antiporter